MSVRPPEASPSSDRVVDAPATPSGWSAILKPVFIPASAIIFGLLIAVVVFARSAGDALAQWTADLNTAITDGVGWWYVIVVNLFLVFAIYCAVSRVGRIRLGRDGERPEFGAVPWFLMLFSAGMGIGLVFFGVAEPLSHYVIPPEAFGNAPESIGAARESVGLMMLQWGLHPWGIYAVVGLGLAYMTFRRGRPLAVRWLLEPLIGRARVEGWMGHAIDVVAIVGTMFGVATSLGFGITQILGGLEYLGWAQTSNGLTLGLIAGITTIAVFSVVTGVHKGLKWLSNINMSVAALLAVTVFVMGPTIFLLKAIPQNIGLYLSMLPETMLHAGAFAGDGWEAAWTIGYWGWWTSWAPFVGIFIARISRGRTIREFIVGVLLAPTLVSLLWFTVLGDSAILRQREVGDLTATDPETGAVTVDSTTSLFQFLESFPGWLAVAMSVVAMIVIVFFFVTSSDSGSLVIDMLASGGNTDTPAATRVYWAVLEGVVAAVLLVFGGNAALTALQTLSISTAAPFSVILVLACLALLRAFRYEVSMMPSHIEVVTGRSTEAGAVPDAVPDAEVPPSLRTRLEHMRGASATLAGLDGATGEGAGTPAGDRIVTFRRLDESHVELDFRTGEVRRRDAVPDPLAGEEFDTPEFRDSHEGATQSRPDTDADTHPEGVPDAER